MAQVQKTRFNPILDVEYNEEIHFTDAELREQREQTRMQDSIDRLLLIHHAQEILDARRKSQKEPIARRAEYNARREEGEAYFLSEEYLQSDELITELYPELFMSFEEYKRSNIKRI